MLQKKGFFPMNGALVFSQTPWYVREDQWAPPPCLHAWQAHTKPLSDPTLWSSITFLPWPTHALWEFKHALIYLSLPTMTILETRITLTDTWQTLTLKSCLFFILDKCNQIVCLRKFWFVLDQIFMYVSALQPQTTTYLEMGRREWLMGTSHQPSHALVRKR